VKSVVEQWKAEGENVSVDGGLDGHGDGDDNDDRGGKSVEKLEIAKLSVRDESTGAILVTTP
jgi:hypothetical protein